MMNVWTKLKILWHRLFFTVYQVELRETHQDSITIGIVTSLKNAERLVQSWAKTEKQPQNEYWVFRVVLNDFEDDYLEGVFAKYDYAGNRIERKRDED